MFISVKYNAHNTVNVKDIEEDLSIKISDVKSLYVKWNTLYLTMKNGEHLEYQLQYVDSEDIDTKHPEAVKLLSEGYGILQNNIQHSDNPFAVETQEDQD